MSNDQTAWLRISVLAFCLALPLAAQATMGKKDMNGHGHAGKTIRKATVGDYTLTYRLIDMRARMKAMQNMPEMAATHHLMLFIDPPEGRSLKSPGWDFW